MEHRILTLFLLAFFSILAACSSPDQAYCDSLCDEAGCDACIDGDCVYQCSGEQVCDGEGNCVPTSSDCEPSCDEAGCEACIDGDCVYQCSGEQDCDGRGNCVPRFSDCEPPCDEAGCEACIDGDCVHQCSGELVCDGEGNCVPQSFDCEPPCDEAGCEACIEGDCVYQCTGEQDCDGEGSCVLPPGVCSPPCDEARCQICINGNCEYQCTEETICNGEGNCVECVEDDHCGAGRGCLAGICRNHCLLSVWCLEGTLSGEHCQQGYCVECKKDADCSGNRYTCSQQSFTCVERGFDPHLTKIGIFYNTWHCPLVNNPPIYDISEILAGRQNWGPEWHFHFWDEPEPGFYCLSQNDALLVTHAEQLSAAGIDFVFIDVTNHTYTDGRSDRTDAMIIKPLERMLAVWSQIPGAPKIVPWVPISEDYADPSRFTIDAILTRMNQYPHLYLNYLGKPLIMVTDNSWHPVSTTRLDALAADYTLRRMWAFQSSGSTMWSFMQVCRNGSPQEGVLCDQALALDSQGRPEQLAISTAYQATYMSLPSSTPKLQGLTFRKQFETLINNPMIPIATITGWNEWMAQRIPCGEHPTCDCGTYPMGCFVDLYDVERNRDIEPGKNEMGDYYYRLLQACIGLFRSGARCDAAHADNLCCRSYTP